MGAPYGWGPNWKKIQESDKFNREREAEERRREAAAEEKRGYDILKNGDLAMNRDNGKIGVIVEAGYRSWVEVHVNEKTHKWPRGCIWVIPKNGDLVKRRDSDETGVVVEAEHRSFIDVLTNGKVHRWTREDVEAIDESPKKSGKNESC
jgi:hypothetical protein